MEILEQRLVLFMNLLAFDLFLSITRRRNTLQEAYSMVAGIYA